MQIDNLIIWLVVIVVGVVLSYIFIAKRSENYWSLPFAGGDVRTDFPDPQRLEDPIGRVMDETDMDGDGYPL